MATSHQLKRVEEELSNAGWNVSSAGALKFGCHFLLYAGDRDDVHSQYGVVVTSHESLINHLEVIGLTRLCHAVGKDLLIASVGPEADDRPIRWTTLSRWKPHID